MASVQRFKKAEKSSRPPSSLGQRAGYTIIQFQSLGQKGDCRGYKAEGYVDAEGRGYVAEGYVDAEGRGYMTEGYVDPAKGRSYMTEGYVDTANGRGYVTEGYVDKAKGRSYVTEGYVDTAEGRGYVTEGYFDTAEGHGYVTERYVDRAKGRGNMAKGPSQQATERVSRKNQTQSGYSSGLAPVEFQTAYGKGPFCERVVKNVSTGQKNSRYPMQFDQNHSMGRSNDRYPAQQAQTQSREFITRDNRCSDGSGSENESDSDG
ncbi:hypothetical protein EUGRSUZ_D01721 [Eucalyptus grandis]|uniref:Uncharacterized protein n=2 Tax=Eucalyptus grandis TaxID=71139 RepID=A0ACC3L679_EUCGR|nr:hypothetical protein EUGRSUZ_D01721 [Eucalyptus grandis]